MFDIETISPNSITYVGYEENEGRRNIYVHAGLEELTQNSGADLTDENFLLYSDLVQYLHNNYLLSDDCIVE